MKSLAEQSYERGVSLHGAGDIAGALAAYAQSLSLDPHNLAALYNRATALAQLQRWPDALAAFDQVVQQAPGVADGWNNRSGVLQAMGRFDEALKSLERALQLRPDDPRALYNAGLMLIALKRFDEAQQVLTRLVTLQPANGEALGSLVGAALQACDWETVEALLASVLAGVRNGTVLLAPLTLLALSDDPQLQLACARTATRRSLADMPRAVAAPMADRAYHHDRVRIGYLSADFRDHPVGNQIVGLLERHDRTRFEIIGLSIGVNDKGTTHDRIFKACDGFISLAQLGSQEAAARIRAAEIDILIDLNGHTMGWRPAILKYRPAPVIATYLGYAGTTGAEFVDYIIGDPHVTPFALAPALSEKIVQLPGGFWPGDLAMPEPEPVSRAQAGLPPDAFVFACFNASHKIRPQIFDVWMRLLQAVPGSVLWLRESSAAINGRFRREAAKRGVDSDRIVFAGRTDSFARHLGRQAQADLFLDTAPYNAHATASDALWAGLPAITCQGASFASRVCAGLLIQAGLGELVTTSLADYEALALALARDPDRLLALRRRLAAARQSFDMDRFVKDIEVAYLQMQALVQRGEAPRAFVASA